MEVHELDAALLARFDRFVAPLLRRLETGYHRTLAREYALGLLGPGERKTVEPIVRRLRGGDSPARERDTREMLNDDWSHNSMMWAAAEQLLEQTDGFRAWTVDDTALLKQGEHSVGVANQYAGCIGGLARCQVLVTVGLAQEQLSTPCAAQLFFPEKWDADAKRRAECHVPSRVKHQPKWQLALRMLDEVEVRDLPRLPVLADAAYGEASDFRRGLERRGLRYVVGVPSNTSFVDAQLAFTAPPPPSGKAGRPSTRMRAVGPVVVQDVGAVARSLPADSFREVVWRMGSKGEQRGRFAAVRVRPARGIRDDAARSEELQPVQWLLIHWPLGETQPTKAWLSNLPESTPLEELIGYARLRWRVERDYREGKALVGLDHFEGRTWHGLHHHAALVVISQMFVALERWRASRDEAEEHKQALQALFPPSAAMRRAIAKRDAREARARRAEQLRDRKATARRHRAQRDALLPDVRA